MTRPQAMGAFITIAAERDQLRKDLDEALEALRESYDVNAPFKYAMGITNRMLLDKAATILAKHAKGEENPNYCSQCGSKLGERIADK